MAKTLAIVIPAFKAEFLEKTLESLASQTCQDFCVYIGDDCSPQELLPIISPFNSRLNMTYHRFSTNLGGRNLVEHWNRCLGLLKDESWFILFSDDDMMDSCCVEGLLASIGRHEEDVYHFNLKIIDGNDSIIGFPRPYPEKLSSLDFFKSLYSFTIDARMPEFVFRRSHFINSGGFVAFEGAMRTDNATVIACAFARGIRTVENNYVYWRDSGKNMSSGQASVEKHVLFYKALIDFFNWFDSFLEFKQIASPWSQTEKLDFMFNHGFNMRKTIGMSALFNIFRRYKRFPKGATVFTAALAIFTHKVVKRFQ